MAKTFRKSAPVLVLAGLAMLRRAHNAPAPRDNTDRRARPQAASDTDGARRSTTDPAQVHDATRGRQADAPHEIPAKGWKDIIVRTFKEFSEDQVPMIAAGITFYTLLAMFPALGAFVALYGLFSDVAQAQQHLQALSAILPADAVNFLGEQMIRLAAGRDSSLSLAFVSGLLLSIWSANGATKAMITGLNIAYEEKEKRKFIAKTATSLAFTLGFLVFGICAFAVIAAVPTLERLMGKPAASLFGWISWPIMLAVLGLGLALLYRFAPSRDRVTWRWISWGSGVALVLWVAASAAFSVYVANFAHYEKTYGSLGAVIGFMVWVWISSQVILLGGELNSEIEHQTAKDTTVGPDKPLGERGAVMADTVGAPQGR